MNGRRWRRRAEYATRSVAATHQHNEILANKTILTLNLKQVARSRRRGQQGRGKVGGGNRSQGEAVRQGRRATPKIPGSNSKSHLLYLHSNGGLSSSYTPLPLSALSACVCQIFILRIGSQDLLISMRAAAGPSAANECKDQARHQSRLDGCPEGPLQQGNRLKSAWKSEHQGTQEDTKTPEVSLTRTAERDRERGRGVHRTLSIVADTNRNQLWKGSAKRNYQLVKWQNEWVRERESEREEEWEWERDDVGTSVTWGPRQGVGSHCHFSPSSSRSMLI